MDVSLLGRYFLSVITDKTFTGLNSEKRDGCFIRNRNCLPFASIRIYPRFFFMVGSVLFIFYVFCVMCFVCVLFPILPVFSLTFNYFQLFKETTFVDFEIT